MERAGVTVIFHDLPWDHEHLEPNEMEDVDFRDAELYWVEFRNLALHRVRWPDHADNETFTHFQRDHLRDAARRAHDGTDLGTRRSRAAICHFPPASQNLRVSASCSYRPPGRERAPRRQNALNKL